MTRTLTLLAVASFTLAALCAPAKAEMPSANDAIGPDPATTARVEAYRESRKRARAEQYRAADAETAEYHHRLRLTREKAKRERAKQAR